MQIRHTPGLYSGGEWGRTDEIVCQTYKNDRKQSKSNHHAKYVQPFVRSVLVQRHRRGFWGILSSILSINIPLELQLNTQVSLADCVCMCSVFKLKACTN